MSETQTQVGKVHLIGAGPGDPKLLTIRAAEAIASSDAIVYDYLVNPEILSHARPGAAIIFVGKRAGDHTLDQELINDLIIERAGLGETVARLKGGDPLVFARGSEEAEALTGAGIPWDFIPGVSSGIAAAAYAGIPLTHRGYSSSVAFITGHESSGKGHNVDWSAAARGADTVVVFMCAASIYNVARKLIAGGRAPSTPIALIRWGTYEYQEVHRGTLEDIALIDARHAPFIAPPVIAVIGKVVSLSEKLHWFGSPVKSIREAIQRGELSHDSEEDAYVTVRRRA